MSFIRNLGHLEARLNNFNELIQKGRNDVEYSYNACVREFEDIEKNLQSENNLEIDNRIQICSTRIKELGSWLETFKSLEELLSKYKSFIHLTSSLDELKSARMHLGALTLSSNSFYKIEIAKLIEEVQQKESFLQFLSENDKGKILGSINQYEGEGSRTVCTSCASAFLANSIIYPSSEYITSDSINACIEEGKNVFKKIDKDRKEQVDSILRSSGGETIDLQRVGYDSELISWTDINLEKYYSHLIQEGNPIQATLESNIFQSMLNAIILLVSYQKEKIPLGGILTCRGKTFSLAFFEKDYVVFDSHGDSRLTGGSSVGFAWKFTSYGSLAQFLSFMLPYKLPIYDESNENDLILFPIRSKIQITDPKEKDVSIQSIPKNELETLSKDFQKKTEIEQIKILREMMDIRCNDAFPIDWLKEKILQVFFHVMPYEMHEKIKKAIFDFYIRFDADLVHGDNFGGDIFRKNPLDPRVKEALDYLIKKFELDTLILEYNASSSTSDKEFIFNRILNLPSTSSIVDEEISKAIRGIEGILDHFWKSIDNDSSSFIKRKQLILIEIVNNKQKPLENRVKAFQCLYFLPTKKEIFIKAFSSFNDEEDTFKVHFFHRLWECIDKKQDGRAFFQENPNSIEVFMALNDYLDGYRKP